MTTRISIHALHEESDLRRRRGRHAGLLFQSTLSMRRATPPKTTVGVPITISIHALHEESDLTSKRYTRLRYISIHALHEESDPASHAHPRLLEISIHALHEESDQRGAEEPHSDAHISIHALHEESDSAAGHFCPLFETQASCLALSISNNTADTTNNMSKTSNWLSVSF